MLENSKKKEIMPKEDSEQYESRALFDTTLENKATYSASDAEKEKEILAQKVDEINNKRI